MLNPNIQFKHLELVLEKCKEKNYISRKNKNKILLRSNFIIFLQYDHFFFFFFTLKDIACINYSHKISSHYYKYCSNYKEKLILFKSSWMTEKLFKAKNGKRMATYTET